MSLFVFDTKGDNEIVLNLPDEEEEILENETESEEEIVENETETEEVILDNEKDESEEESSDSSESDTDNSPGDLNALKPATVKAFFKGSNHKGILFPLRKDKRTISKSSHPVTRTIEEEKVIHELSVAKAKRQDTTPTSLIDILNKNLTLDDEETDEDFILMPRGSDEDSDDDPVIIREIPKLRKLIPKSVKKMKKKRHEDYSFREVLIEAGKGATDTLKKVRSEEMHKLLQEKSIAMKPGFEKLERLPPAAFTYKQRKLRKAERAKTKGGDWFNLPATEVTEEVKRDLEVLQMRSIIDPKTFYKKNDLKVLPKYFQVGHVEDSSADFYHSRIPKKDRKRTMVEELMADAEFQQRSKKKFKEIVQEKKCVNSKAHKHARRLKKQK